jgi:hypothetical protein
MKTAVSIPDDFFQGEERLVQRHAPEHVTEAMDRVCVELEGEHVGKPDEFVSMVGRRVLERTEW